MTVPLAAAHHHFCRWMLPEGHSPSQALELLFPGSCPSEAAEAIQEMPPKRLREVFGVIFGAPTTSNNTHWMRAKLCSALGLGRKKPAGAGRKRARPADEESSQTLPQKGGTRADATATAAAAAMASMWRPSPPPPQLPLAAPAAPDVQWAAAGLPVAGFTTALPAAGIPGLARSPSGSEESTGGMPAQQAQLAPSPAADGAATLLAAAAQVDGCTSVGGYPCITRASSSDATTALHHGTIEALLGATASLATPSTAATTFGLQVGSRDAPYCFALAPPSQLAAVHNSSGSFTGQRATGAGAAAAGGAVPGQASMDGGNPWAMLFAQQLEEAKRQLSLLRVLATLAHSATPAPPPSALASSPAGCPGQMTGAAASG